VARRRKQAQTDRGFTRLRTEGAEYCCAPAPVVATVWNRCGSVLLLLLLRRRRWLTSVQKVDGGAPAAALVGEPTITDHTAGAAAEVGVPCTAAAVGVHRTAAADAAEVGGVASSCNLITRIRRSVRRGLQTQEIGSFDMVVISGEHCWIRIEDGRMTTAFFQNKLMARCSLLSFSRCEFRPCGREIFQRSTILQTSWTRAHSGPASLAKSSIQL
jgi:hypothetical protein